MLARSHHVGYNSTTCDRCKPGWPPNVQKAHKRGCSDAGIAPYPESSVVAHSTHSPLLVLAVTTTATKKALGMRAEIRRGWDMMVTPGFVGRFAFGVHNHSATAAALAGEHATHRDLLFVAQSVSANGNARETVLGWWRVAAGLFPRARFLAKADDDCFVHLPRLLAHVEKLAGCHPFLYMGSMIYGVRDAATPCSQMACFGWDYSRGQARECAARKLPQPYPFAAGTLELVAMQLAHFFASDATVATEAARALAEFPSVVARCGTGKPYEDVMVGGWAHRAAFDRKPWRVQPVGLPPLNIHNLACLGLGAEPFPALVPDPEASIVVHNLKTKLAHRYVREVLLHGRAPSSARCQLARSRHTDKFGEQRMIEIETGAVAAVATHLRRSASTLSLRDLFFHTASPEAILGTSLAHGGLATPLCRPHACGKCAWLKKCKNVTVHELRGWQRLILEAPYRHRRQRQRLPLSILHRRSRTCAVMGVPTNATNASAPSRGEEGSMLEAALRRADVVIHTDDFPIPHLRATAEAATASGATATLIHLVQPLNARQARAVLGRQADKVAAGGVDFVTLAYCAPQPGHLTNCWKDLPEWPVPRLSPLAITPLRTLARLAVREVAVRAGEATRHQRRGFISTGLVALFVASELCESTEVLGVLPISQGVGGWL